ncbi:hypothetical protein [Nocardioides sp. AN3]
MEQPSLVASEPAPARARVSPVPIALASVAAALAVLWMLVWLLGVSVFLWSPNDLMPEGVRAVDPTATEIARATAQRVGVPLLAVAALVVTWRAAHRRRVGRCWVAALVTIGLALVAFV